MRTGTAVQAMLVGMPEPEDLHRVEADGQVLIMVGARVLASYRVDDGQMRNMAAVTLAGLGFTARRVAAVLGITEQYLSTLRARVARQGSAALTRRRGRPAALGAGQLRRARAWRAQGCSDTAIGRRLDVHPTTVARALTGTVRAGQDGTDGADGDGDGDGDGDEEVMVMVMVMMMMMMTTMIVQ